jgi:hypothetical protein
MNGSSKGSVMASGTSRLCVLGTRKHKEMSDTMKSYLKLEGKDRSL